MDFSYLTTASYWFSASPDYKTKMYIPAMVIFGLMLLFGIAIYYFKKGEFRSVWVRYAKPMMLTSVLGFMYLVARYEQLPYLAARAVLAIIFFYFLLRISYLTFWSAKNVPVMIKEKDVEEKFSKYLPRQKK